MSDVLLVKADDFTSGTSPKGGEVRTLEAWLVIALHAAGLLPLAAAQAIVRVINAGEPQNSLPAASLRTGLRAEHYRSLLPADPEDFLPEERAQLDQLNADFEQVIAAFLALAPPTVPEPPAPEPPETHPAELAAGDTFPLVQLDP